jgi:hypothetical protein
MKKLDDIPKKNIFEVPDRYFDELPGVIQARVTGHGAARSWSPSWAWSLRYAVPVVVLMAVGIVWFQTDSRAIDVESQLSEIQSEQLADYLEDHDLTTEDLIETVVWSPADLTELEQTVYSTYEASHLEIEKVLDEYNVEL